MNITVLHDQPASTAFLTGPITGGTRATVVARTAYQLIATTGDRAMIAQPADHADHQIIFSDQYDPTPLPSEWVDGDGDPVTPIYNQLWEADIALEKSRPDVVVIGYVDNDLDSASIQINGAPWQSRTSIGIDLTGDVSDNLFGW